MLYQTFIYPNIEKILGPINTSRVAAVSSILQVSMIFLHMFKKIVHIMIKFCRFYLWFCFLLTHL